MHSFYNINKIRNNDKQTKCFIKPKLNYTEVSLKDILVYDDDGDNDADDGGSGIYNNIDVANCNVSLFLRVVSLAENYFYCTDIARTA